MECKKCGHVVNENERFCSECGANVEEIVENTAFENDVMPNAEESKNLVKKRFGVKAVVAIAVVAVIIVALICGFTSPSLNNTVMKTMLSSDKYLQYVIKNEVSDSADTVVDLLADYQDIYSDDFGVNGKFNVEIGKGLDTLVRTVSGEGIPSEFDFVKSVGIDYSTVSGRDATAVEIGVNLNGTDITTAEVAVDMKDGMSYITLPEINSESIASELMTDMEDASLMTNVMYDVLEALPDKNVTKALIKKYVKCATEQINEVAEETAKLEVGGLVQNMTKLDVTISERTLLNICVAALEEVKADKEIKNIINDVVNVESLNLDTDTYGYFIENVESALEELSYVEPSEDELFGFCVFVDNNGGIAGLEFDVEGVKILYSSIEKGGKFASEFKVSAGYVTVAINGAGKISFGKKTGDFALVVNGMELAKISMEDVDEDKLEKGVFNGSMTITPSEGLSGLMSMSGESMLSQMISNFKLEIKSDSDSIKKTDYSITFYNADEMCVNISNEGVINNGKKISAPQNYIAADDYEASEKWIEACNFESLIENLEKAGTPSSITNIIRENLAE